MADRFDLASVVVTIKNPTIGTITLSGGSNKESILTRRTNDLFSIEGSADGGNAVSANRNKAGEIEITINQTSRNIGDLTDFANFCQENPELAPSTIEIKDAFGVIKSRAEDVHPINLPDNTVGQTAGMRTFRYLTAKLDMQEGA